jgi:hypothetical protein
MNEKYSHKDFTGKSLLTCDPKELSHTTVRGSCFAQEVPCGKQAEFVDIFPKGMTNVTFVGCNLDNVRVPDGCKIEDGTHKLIEIRREKDAYVAWIMSDKGIPVSKLNPDPVVAEI